MQLLLNGRSVETEAGTLYDLLIEHGVDPEQRGIAVAINGDVILRSEWKGRELGEGDDLELITAMQGG